MSHLILPPEDLPPAELLPLDLLLQQELEEAVRKHFYQACDGVTQGLLLMCDWKISITAEALQLTISCPDQPSSWRVLNNIAPIGIPLALFSPTAKIRICPPPTVGNPVEIRVDEISV